MEEILKRLNNLKDTPYVCIYANKFLELYKKYSNNLVLTEPLSELNIFEQLVLLEYTDTHNLEDENSLYI